MDGEQQQRITISVEEVFSDFRKRRNGLIMALTTELEKFFQECDPANENLCLFGLPNGLWEVNLPVEEVPPTIPEPILGINFARDGMREKDWVLLVAMHSNCWLISVAFFYGAQFGFDKDDRMRLFQMINELPTLVEVFTRKQRMELSTKSNLNKTKLSREMPRSSEPRPKRVKMSRPPKEDSESDEQEDETLCGACGYMYAIDEFWIFCDACEIWFHGKCVKVTPAMAEHIDLYTCPDCCSKRARVH